MSKNSQDEDDVPNEATGINEHKDKKAKKNWDIPWKIYISRGMSAWGDRLWSFGAGIFMVELAPENLRLVAIHGLVISVSVILFGAILGSWIDRSKRLTAARTFLVIQNTSVALASTLLALYFGKVGESVWPDWLPTAMQVIIIFIADIAELASVGSKIVIEKDWIVVISRNDNDRLSQINAVFRTLDLTTLSLSPLVAGLVFDLVSSSAAAIFIAAWNIVSVVIEYFLLHLIYQEYPQLAVKKVLDNQEKQEQDPKIDDVKVIKKESSCNPCSRITELAHGWWLYMKYPVRNAGFGLAFLYMTVLGFDNITYGFCLQQCVRESILGGLVGVSAIFGVSGSISFPFFRKYFGLTKTGLIGMTLLILTLVMCVVSIVLPGSPFDPDFLSNLDKSGMAELGNRLVSLTPMSSNDTSSDLEQDCQVESFVSVIVLMSGLITARFGLWVSDLTITQILQERVQEEHRGVIGGVQNSLNSSMDMIKFILVIILPEPETFGWLIIASFSSICLGALFYSSYVAFYHNHQDHQTKSKKDTIVHQPDTKYKATEDASSPPVQV